MGRKRKHFGGLMTDVPKTAVSIKSDLICLSCKRCARKIQTRCLPQDMLFNILLHFPAQVLHDVMRYVCTDWNLMISSPNFIHHHLRNSTGGIIFQPPFTGEAIYVEMRRDRLEICKFDGCSKDLVVASCNGLVLGPVHGRNYYSLCLFNFLTKQRVTLPPYFLPIGFYGEFYLAFIEASMEYKVVSTRNNALYKPKQIFVLIVGVDRVWRPIDVEHFSLMARRAFVSIPVVTGGYVHWIGDTIVLTLNAETETICCFSLPQLQKTCGKFLPSGSNLSVVDESSQSSWDVWEMNSETGEWTMLLSFDPTPLTCTFEVFFCKYESIIPLGWLAAREVLVFSTSRHQRLCVAYNFKTGEIQPFELDTVAKSYHIKAHVNSLVKLKEDFKWKEDKIHVRDANLDLILRGV